MRSRPVAASLREGQGVGVADHGDDQAVVEGDGDADVNTLPEMILSFW